MFNLKTGRVRRPVPPGAPRLRMRGTAPMRMPDALPRTGIDPGPRMLGNDVIGDCTCAGLANAIMAQSALNGFTIPIQTQSVEALYSAATGYVPGDPATDKGCNEIDLFGYQDAFGFDIGLQSRYAARWANIPADDINLLGCAVERFGVGYLGVNLAIADQQMGGTWDTITPTSYGDPTPGSWSPHCLLLWAWHGTGDKDLVSLLTWGTVQYATMRWLRSRLEEAHAVFHPQVWAADPNGRALLAQFDAMAGHG